MYIYISLWITVSIDINSLGTPPINTINRLTFQARLLHNQEGANADKGGFRKISSRAFFKTYRSVVFTSSWLWSNRAWKVNLLIGGVPRLSIVSTYTLNVYIVVTPAVWKINKLETKMSCEAF